MKCVVTFCLGFLVGAHALASTFHLEPTDVLRTKGQYYDLAIASDTLFLAAKLGIEIYSLADPANPVRIGGFITDGLANGIAVNLPWIYVGDVYGFSIWDISDMQNPVLRSQIRTDSATGYQERLIYRDGLVFVAAYTSGIQVFDVADPDRPFLVGQAKTGAYAWDMVVTETAIYVMDFFSMSIVDIRRPEFPVTRSQVDAMFASGAAARDDRLYLGYIEGLRIMDLRDPFNPVDMSDIGPTGSGTAETVSLMGDYAWVGHNGYIEVYDIRDPTDPERIAYFYPPGHPRKLLAHEGFLYTVLDDNGFLVTDISDPANPVQMQHINPGTWGTRNDVVWDNGWVFLCDWNRGLVIYEIDADGKLQERVNYSGLGALRECIIRDSRMYLVSQSAVEIVDISNRYEPVSLGSYETSGSPQNVHVIGDRMYLCDLYGLYILDISNPAAITRLGTVWLAREGNPYDVRVMGLHAFIANGWKGMKVVDVSDPADPKWIATWPGDNAKSYVAVQERQGHLFFLDPSRGIDVLDVSNPLQPVQVAALSFDGFSANDFLIDGNLLALAVGESGIQIWDIGSLESPVLVARADTPGDALGVTLSDSHVFVADEFDLAVFRRRPFSADPASPQITIASPAHLDRIMAKTAVVRGTGNDTGSGIRFVEVSTDQGATWKRAFGQEEWSCVISGFETGPVPVRARAVDWSGRLSEAATDIWIYWDPDVPRIWVAGLESTRIDAGAAKITVSALVQDPWDAVYIQDAVLTIDGETIDTVFEFVAENGGIRYYRMEREISFPDPGFVTWTVLFRDIYQNRSTRWPNVPTKW
ncbi:hypothetical protein JXA80_10490 [bacterium]|nr:hypothetical protein [candidate division CSSED10-310 bacterium]